MIINFEPRRRVCSLYDTQVTDSRTKRTYLTKVPDSILLGEKKIYTYHVEIRIPSPWCNQAGSRRQKGCRQVESSLPCVGPARSKLSLFLTVIIFTIFTSIYLYINKTPISSDTIFNASNGTYCSRLDLATYHLSL